MWRDIIGAVTLGLLLLAVLGFGAAGTLPLFYAWGQIMRDHYERWRRRGRTR